MKQNTKAVIDYLKSTTHINSTAADVAAQLGLDKKVVDGIFTSAVNRKGLGARVEAEAVQPDGTHKMVKYLRLTQAGLDVDTTVTEA